MSAGPTPKARGRAAALMQRLATRTSSSAAEIEATGGNFEKKCEEGQEKALPVLTPVNSNPASKPNISRSKIDFDRPKKKFADKDAGQPYETQVNYLRIACDLPGGCLSQHHVSFTPDVENFRVRGQIMKQKEVFLAIGEISSFDGGHSLILPMQLQDVSIQTTHPITGDPVNVFVKFTNLIEMGNLMFFFNRLLKQLMDALNWVQIGRDNHYYNPKVRYELRQHALEIWPGFATSCKRAQDGGLVIELDVSSHVLRSETVWDAFLRINSERLPNMKDECLRQVLNEVVSTRYNNRTYKIEDIKWDSNPLSTFELKNKQTMTFLDYYRTQHGIQLKDPKQPLLVSKLKAGRWKGGRNGSSAQLPDRTVLLVPELCFLTGLSDNQRSNFNLMRDVGEYTRLTPVQRVGAIRKFLDSITTNEKCRDILKKWGLSFSLELVKVDGHLFAPEPVFTGGDSPDNPMRCDNYDPGDFSALINRARPLQTVPISNWCIIYSNKSQREAQDFLNLMTQTSKQLSVQVDRPEERLTSSHRTMDFVQAIRSVTSATQPRIVVVVLPSKSEDHYIAVKREMNTVGIPSQVIVAKTLANPKKITSICRRIFLQMEAKLGGQLWGLTMPPQGLMVVGLDVFHDPSRRSPSWVALVGSINQEQTRYYSVACKQMPGEEAAHGVGLGVTKLINAYRQVNSFLPKKLIFFRDGLSASQFRMSAEFEMKQILDSFKSMGDSYSPELVFIVCVKRIGVRIFSSFDKQCNSNNRPSSRGGLHDNGGYSNPPPGLAIDQVIGEPNWYDFYLISQAVRQGAVSPTHYVVIADTSRYSASQVQRLTWKFTHLYYNWPGTVRSPAPVVYADRLAGMVGQVLQTEPHANLQDKLFYL